MKRVAIIGLPGTGKSTFAEQLGKLAKIPVIHLDKEFHDNQHRYQNDREAWKKDSYKLADGDKWIIDGNVGNSIAKRLERADTIFYFDYSTQSAVKGVISRQLKSKKGVQPYNFHGKFDTAFLWRVVNWKKNYGKDTKRLLIVNSRKAVIVFKNRKQAEAYLGSYK